MNFNKLIKKKPSGHFTFILLIILVSLLYRYNTERFIDPQELLERGPAGIEGGRGGEGPRGGDGPEGEDAINIIRQQYGYNNENTPASVHDIITDLFDHIKDKVIERLSGSRLQTFKDRIKNRYLNANPAPNFDPIDPRKLSEFPDYSIVSFQNTSGTLIPNGWQVCNGSRLKFNDNTTSTTIDTPDLRGRFVQGAGTLTEEKIIESSEFDPVGTGPRVSPNVQEATLTREAKTYTINETGGRGRVSLREENIPEHTHSYDGGFLGRKYEAITQTEVCSNGTSRPMFSALNNRRTGLTGAGETAEPDTVMNPDPIVKPFNIMPPFYILIYIIKQPAV
jgi:microcystin-dependent protein